VHALRASSFAQIADLEVVVSGLSSKNLQSTAQAEVVMTDSTGKTIWESSSRDIRIPGNPLRGMKNVKRADLEANPELRKNHLSTTALNIARRIAAEIPSKK
jgi:hypothetical protein